MPDDKTIDDIFGDSVPFVMEINDNYSLEDLNLAELGIIVYTHLKNLNYLVCGTTKEIYEALFDAKLEYDPVKANKMGYTSNGYRELIDKSRMDEKNGYYKRNLDKRLKSKIDNVMLNYKF